MKAFGNILLFLLLVSCGSSSTTPTDPILTFPGPTSGSVLSSSSFANNSQVAYAKGQYKNIQDFAKGDDIYSADTGLNWGVKKVYFAGGVSKGTFTMLYIFLTSGSQDKEIIVTQDTYILMSDGKLKRCDRLRPGEQVQGSDGTLYTVSVLEMGNYYGGVYGVGTDGNDGHYLIDVNGIVFSHYGFLPQDAPIPPPPF